jgi:signal transduction histidine kinase
VRQNRSKTYRVAFILLAFAALLTFVGEPWNRFGSYDSFRPTAVSGVLDLRDWDIEAEGITKLNGDWEFYWNALLSPDDFARGQNAMSGYTGPEVWNRHTIGGKKLPGQGYATYLLRILMRPDGQRLALRVPFQSTSFRLWVNGRELAANGKVGTSLANSVPQYMPITVTIDNNQSEIEVVMQVSNFTHRRGGMWDTLELGTEAALRVKNARLVLLDMLSIGSLLTMGSYQIMLFLMRKKDRSAVYFAGICLCFGIRAFLVGDVVITKIWPDFSWAAALRLEYLTSAGILPFALLFVRELYPNETSKAVVQGGLGLYAFFSTIVLVFPTTVGSQSMVYYQFGSGTLSAYILYALISAAIRKREGAVWLAASAAFFILTLANDVLYFNSVIHTETMSSLGLVVVCFAQSYVLAARYSGALVSVELLSDQLTVVNQQLTELNRGLEQRVGERTSALMESNKRLEAINAEIERIEKSRRHLLANIAHDLRTPVTLIQGYVEAMLDGVIEDPQQRAKYLNLIAGKAKGLSHLIADLFELTQLESRRVTFNMRPVPLDDMVESLYMKYETDISNAGITPALVRPTGDKNDGVGFPLVNADPERIDRVFSNLIYNALKFTPKGGTVTVSYGLGPSRGPLGKPKDVVISIADTGGGIPAEDLPYIFDRFYKVQRSRPAASGSGLGLAIARETVELHGGRIWAESKLNEGSKFSFTLPFAT